MGNCATRPPNEDAEAAEAEATERLRRQHMPPITINVLNTTEDEEVQVTVKPWEGIHGSVRRELRINKSLDLAVTFGDLPCNEEVTWEGAGVESDATVRALVSVRDFRVEWHVLVGDIEQLNPGIEKVKLRSAATFNEDGTMRDLFLVNLELQELPNRCTAF